MTRRGADQLVLVRRPGPAGTPWQADAIGGGSGSARRGPLHALLQAGEPVVLLAPAVDVAVHRISLPAMRAAERMNAVPFALEERLAEPPEGLVFALERRTGDQYDVAVVRRARLAGWLAAVATCGARVRAIVPEWALLPAPEADETLVCASDERIWICAGNGERLAAEPPVAAAVLDTWLAQSASGGGTVRIIGMLPREMRAHPRLAAAGASASELDWRARWLSHHRSAGPDLLADALQRTPPAVFPRQWRGAAAACIGALVLAAGVAFTELRHLEHATALWEARMQTAYANAFPSERNVADVRRRLRQKQQSASGGGADDSGPLPALASLTRVLRDAPNLRLESIRFDGATLLADVAADTLAALEGAGARIGGGEGRHTARLTGSVATQDGARGTFEIRTAMP